MKNWKDYIAFNHISPDADEVSVYYLILRILEENNEQRISFAVEREFLSETDFIYSEDTIGDAVEEALLSFPAWDGTLQLKEGLSENAKTLLCNMIKNDIAKNSRRGAGNTQLSLGSKEILFYKNETQKNTHHFDAPLFVSEMNGKYAITKHPNFDQYGYTFTF